MRTARHRIVPLLLSAALAFGATACDGNARDDLENIEENIEEGVDEVGDEVGDAVEDGGDAVEEGTDELGDDDGEAGEE